MRKDALLCSINARLAGQPGQEISPLSLDWLDDLILLQELDAERDRMRQRDRPNSVEIDLSEYVRGTVG